MEMNYSGIVIGLGEVGMPLYLLLRSKYPNTIGLDKDGFYGGNPEPQSTIDVLNICLPYSQNFVHIVMDYSLCYKPKLIIVHSTVPVGTTTHIRNKTGVQTSHSPILGDHTNMISSLKNFNKWIGGDGAENAAVYLGLAGVPTRIVKTSEETELLKLMCLAKYGMSIAFAQMQRELCDLYEIDYSKVIEWDMNYNAGVNSSKQRPILNPPGKTIGGHCIISGTRFLSDICDNPILVEILKYGE